MVDIDNTAVMIMKQVAMEDVVMKDLVMVGMDMDQLVCFIYVQLFSLKQD